jgi:ribose transport system permease protein
MTTLYAQRSRDGRSRRSRLRLVDLQRRWPILQVVALVAISAYGALTLPNLTTWGSIKTILVLASLIGLASVGQTLVILIGGFDLSIPGFMVASAYLITTIKDQQHFSFAFALALAIAFGAGLGALSGQICHRYGVQPLIVTLGIGGAAAGLAQSLAGDASVGQSAAWAVHLTSVGTRTFGVGVPPLVVIWALVGIVATIVIHRTVLGRRVLAVGANQRAAEYSLINSRRVWTLTFAFSGVVSVLAGLLVAGFAGNLDSAAANPYLFQSLVAVVIGGTIFGGPGDYARTILGALFLAVLNVVLIGSGATPPDQDILYGVVLVLAVTLYGRERALGDRI